MAQPGNSVRVSPDGGLEPLFSRDGRELFFRRGDEMWSSSITLSGEGQVIARKPTPAQPQFSPGSDTDIVKAKSIQLVIGHAARKRLRTLSEETRGRTAQHEKGRRTRWPIGEDAQERKELRAPLHLVDDDQPVQTAKRRGGVVEPTGIGGVFEIEGGEGPIALSATARATVVLPTWRGPSRPTIGCRLS